MVKKIKNNLVSVSAPSYNWSFILGVVAVLVLGLNIFILSEKLNSITGFATDTGITNVTIEGYGIINFTTDFLNFGSGSVENGKNYALLRSGNDSFALNASASWISNAANLSYFNKSLVVANIGNKNFSTLSFESDKDAASFIGGTSPGFKYRFSTNVSSCNATTPSKLGTFLDANATGSGTVCAPFGYASGSNHLFVDVELGIPYNSIQGSLTATITAIASGADYIP